MCIPINAAKPLIEEVLSGKVTTATQPASDSKDSMLAGQARMGVTATSMNTSHPALTSGQLPNGAYVTEVEEGGPADKAGIQVGDIIVDVNGTVITTSKQLQTLVYSMSAGDTLTVKVYRVPGLDSLESTDDIPDGEYIDLSVTLEVVDSTKQ